MTPLALLLAFAAPPPPALTLDFGAAPAVAGAAFPGALVRARTGGRNWAPPGVGFAWSERRCGGAWEPWTGEMPRPDLARLDDSRPGTAEVRCVMTYGPDAGFGRAGRATATAAYRVFGPDEIAPDADATLSEFVTPDRSVDLVAWAVRALGKPVLPAPGPGGGIEKRFWTVVPASDPPAVEPAWGEPERDQPPVWGPPGRGDRDLLFRFGFGYGVIADTKTAVRPDGGVVAADDPPAPAVGYDQQVRVLYETLCGGTGTFASPVHRLRADAGGGAVEMSAAGVRPAPREVAGRLARWPRFTPHVPAWATLAVRWPAAVGGWPAAVADEPGVGLFERPGGVRVIVRTDPAANPAAYAGAGHDALVLVNSGVPVFAPAADLAALADREHARRRTAAAAAAHRWDPDGTGRAWRWYLVVAAATERAPGVWRVRVVPSAELAVGRPVQDAGLLAPAGGDGADGYDAERWEYRPAAGPAAADRWHLPEPAAAGLVHTR